MLTPKQYNLLMYVNKVVKETGCCPSFDEMKTAIGLKSKSGIHALLESLEERNFIKKMPHKARALEILRLPKFKPSEVVAEEKKREEALQNSVVNIPLYDENILKCVENIENNEIKTIAVPFEMVNYGKYYAFKVTDNSLMGIGIVAGDMAIIKKSSAASNGDVVIAKVDNTRIAMRELCRDNGVVSLIPKNKRYETESFDISRVKVQGILKGILRKY